MWLSYLTMILLMLVGLLLIVVVLLQRGRGGGLAGALGGMGGQSAFGTKAGDVFTRITIVIAVIWVVLAGVSGFALRADANRLAQRVAGQFGDAEDEEEEEADAPPIGRTGDEAAGGLDTKSFTPPDQPKSETKSTAPAQPEAKKAADKKDASAAADTKSDSAPADSATPKK